MKTLVKTGGATVSGTITTSEILTPFKVIIYTCIIVLHECLKDDASIHVATESNGAPAGKQSGARRKTE